jgi:probable F420-dependent oxidoreductase
VAKQAAEADVLSGGRLRLGVGVGWNVREFEALGLPFERRGRFFEEQLEVLRRLWTEPVVTYEGEFHTIRSAGLQMLPVQRPIPLWLGGDAPRVLERIGRLGDGWYCNARELPGEDFDRKVSAIRAAAQAAGRDPAAIGVETRQIVGHDDDDFAAAVERWRRAGITHLAVDTMNVGRSTLAEHVDALQRASKLLGLG